MSSTSVALHGGLLLQEHVPYVGLIATVSRVMMEQELVPVLVSLEVRQRRGESFGLALVYILVIALKAVNWVL